MRVELLRFSAQTFKICLIFKRKQLDWLELEKKKPKKLAAETFFFPFLFRVYLNFNLNACVNLTLTAIFKV